MKRISLLLLVIFVFLFAKTAFAGCTIVRWESCSVIYEAGTYQTTCYEEPREVCDGTSTYLEGVGGLRLARPGTTCHGYAGCQCIGGGYVEDGETCQSLTSNNLGYCGDGICTGTCQTCPADCGACPVPQTSAPPAQKNSTSQVVGGDSSPQGTGTGGCGDGLCSGGESCSTCASDCGVCSCGNFICDGGESCSSCAIDCGVCATNYCGDNLCTAFENCATCSQDCGVCNASWWQVSGGHAYAGATQSHAVLSAIPDATTCTYPCTPFLTTPDASQSGTLGIPISGGGAISANQQVNQADRQVIDSQPTRYRETYAYFYRLSDLGLRPTDDFPTDHTDAQKPSLSKSAYFRDGDLTIQSPWHIRADEKIVVFVVGDLTLSDPFNQNRLTQVEEGGFLAFIVSGDIFIDASLGNEDMSDTPPNLEGVFVADGEIIIQSTGDTATEQRFIGAGTFVGHTDVRLERDIGQFNSQTTPAEQFMYRPDFVTNLPDWIKKPQRLWQEVR